MKIDDIPQDNSASYHGHRKVIYGTRDGHYEAATSNGWQDEAYATEMAVFELDAQTQAAREAVEKGEYSRCTTICSAVVMMKPAWPCLQAYGNGSFVGISVPKCSPNYRPKPCKNTPMPAKSA